LGRQRDRLFTGILNLDVQVKLRELLELKVRFEELRLVHGHLMSMSMQRKKTKKKPKSNFEKF